jgi:hypothetical protein
MKILPVEPELSHVKGQTDRQAGRQTERETDRHDEAKSRFLQFCERS